MPGGSGTGQNSAAHAVILRRGSGQCDGLTGQAGFSRTAGTGTIQSSQAFVRRRGPGDTVIGVSCHGVAWSPRAKATATVELNGGGRSSASVTAPCSYRHATITQHARAPSQVIPRALMPVEILGESVGEVKVVSDMHERKAEMARRSEAFIALPGGYGTMEELLEMITWSQLGIHNKPVGLLNVDGYYDTLLALFDKGAREGFINPDCTHILVSAPTAAELLTKMEQYTRSHQEVAPTTSWEISELGYTTAPPADG
ncbi:unnamed protein product [Triticum turgidum subsp. durum]|uniref:Cytokinin riboside 5'-monophosphate phosphoribohydrolase n=1 Tax=Triticum turgidum subsp. durum TaxID=4567 RepID=A0A9R0UZ34_TRITD|nr:unnamed protein product [Triticum turgidum subsp. durum]